MNTIKILKKNGKIENFNIAKIKTSIANSADDIEITITESDLNMVLKEIEKNLNELKGTSLMISSKEIRNVVYQVLLDCGFSEVAKSYMIIDA